MMPILYTPANEDELNEIIANSKALLDKYFHLSLSERRSEKLRDFVCENIGFTNGGYQQLQSLWDRARSFEALNGAMDWRVSLHGGQYRCDGYFVEAIAKKSNVLDTIAATLGNEDKNGVDDHSWAVSASGVGELPKSTRKHSVWLHDVAVGYAESKEDAALLGGLILAAKVDMHVDFGISTNQESSQTEAGRNYLLLRASSQDYGFHIEFTDLTLESAFDTTGHLTRQRIVLQSVGYGLLEIEFIESSRSYRFNGIDFDFAIAYFDENENVSNVITLPSGDKIPCRRCEFDGLFIQVSQRGKEYDDDIYVKLTPKQKQLSVQSFR